MPKQSQDKLVLSQARAGDLGAPFAFLVQILLFADFTADCQYENITIGQISGQ